MNYKEIKQQIIDAVGGESNIVNVTHCATRLRLVLKDEEKFKEEEVNKIKGVINTLKMGGQCQLIIGPDVKELYNEFSQGTTSRGCETKKKKFKISDIFQNLFGFLGACVGIYIIPLIGGGLIKAGLTISVQLGLLTTASDTYTVFWFAADAVFQFLPIFVAIGASRKLNANQMLAVYSVAIMLSPVFLNYVNSGTPLTLFGINMPLISYYNGFLPAVITVVVMAYIERGLKRIIPSAAQQLLLPFLIILIMTPVALLITGPIAQELGNLLAQPLITMSDYTWIVVTVLGFIMPLMIMFGLHSAIFTFTFTVLLPTFGYDPMFMPASFCSHIAMGAVALAIFFKSKNIEIKTNAISSCATIWVGSVSEPVIFGVLAQNKISMIAACIGGGGASLIAGIFGLKCYAIAGSGIMHMPTFIGEESSWTIVIIAMVIAITVSMLIVFIFYEDRQ